MLTTAPNPKKPVAPPSEDKRWRIVTGRMRRNGNRPSGLIEALHAVQEAFGYIDEDALRYVAAVLRVPLSKVYGVATFYHFFTLKPQGEHNCVVCMGTACYIKGTPAILAKMKDRFGIEPGETTDDDKLSVLSARCVGACGLAPAVVFDGEVAGKLTPEQTLERIERMIGS
jgi:bidirectional [NiFe] hydrogenase diaphorase subunit